MNRFHLVLAMFATTVVAACSGAPQINAGAESSAAAIRAAEEVGAGRVPRAALLLQLAKEESAKAQALTKAGEPEKAASMQMRAETDANLALTMTRAEDQRLAAVAATERAQKLRQGGQ